MLHLVECNLLKVTANTQNRACSMHSGSKMVHDNLHLQQLSQK